jgi:hypothetical protein
MRFVLARLLLAFVVGCVGLLTVCVSGRSETGTVWDQLPDSNSSDLLVGPGQRRKSDDTRNLSAPPSNASPGATAPGRAREISPSERRDIMQNRAREVPFDWSTSRDRD